MTYIVSHETYSAIYRLFNIYQLFNIYIESIINIYRNQYKYTKYSRHIQSYPQYVDNIDNMDNMDNITLNYRFRHNMVNMTQYMDNMTESVQLCPNAVSHIGQYMRPHNETILYLNIDRIIHKIYRIIHKISTGYKYLSKCLREGPYPKINLQMLISLSHINISNRNRK